MKNVSYKNGKVCIDSEKSSVVTKNGAVSRISATVTKNGAVPGKSATVTKNGAVPGKSATVTKNGRGDVVMMAANEDIINLLEDTVINTEEELNKKNID